EMAMPGKIGAVVATPAGIAAHAFWFGEDQARYLVTAPDADAVARLAKAAAVPLIRLGATGGRAIAIDGERPVAIDELRERFEHWLPAYMAGPG
ncbi:MAG: phosphoribosylformylglycinamidine synthase II, partial [Hyphomicrobiales bacterium]|nr:phosphoribosylformylglycinamidine synthase II [Hyphomicrobiales bacterium]